VVSERFELGRNFCNKLWNASRFALLNLEGYSAAPVADEDLAVEDRWLLSRLATVTAQTTAALEAFHYGDAARVLYDFAWNEFCSFYVEMAKGRLQNVTSRATAQRVLAHTLDAILRLLHPLIPFITEEVWQLLAQAAPRRGIAAVNEAAASIMIAPWPEAELERQDARIEAQFARFQELLNKLRDTRSRHNIPPKTPMHFAVRCEADVAELLRPMDPYFESMAGAKATAWGPAVQAPPTSASFVIAEGEVFVDLADHIDVEAEIARKAKEVAKIAGSIAGKERQLANENIVSRAPAEVIDKERAALAQLKELLATTQAALDALEATRK
jgi:valyl-tRNA synthetase